MSENKPDDQPVSSSSQPPIHLLAPSHRSIPPTSQVAPAPPQFQDSSQESSSNSATSFPVRPKTNRFSMPFQDASSNLTTLSAAVTQLPSTLVHSFSTSSVTNTGTHQPPSGITQVLAAGLISQPQGHAPSSNPVQSQHQFQKLKVEDALSYLDQVKYQFGNQPQVYNDFLDIMKEFKSQSIDTPGVIARVSHLFNGHPDLIVGFNTFLPPGYKIEVSANDQVNVTGPNMISQTIHPLSGLMEPSQQSSTTTIQVNVHTPHGKFATTLPQLPTHRSSPAPPPAGGAQALPSTMFPQQRGNPPSSSSSGQNTNTASNPLLGNTQVTQPQGTGVGGQPVEFNHAINYVNKIKNRFQGQPDIYKAFLEILHKYQKEQRNVKDSNGSYVPSLSESEVYSQVARLFQNDDDLLREFGQFLPDAGGAVSSGSASSLSHATTFAGSPASNSQKVDSVMNDHGSTVKKQSSSSQSSKQHRSNSQQAVKRIAQPATHIPSGKRAKSSSLKDVSIAEASKCGTLSEFAYFDNVRRALHSQEAYDNFLRCLLLYNNEVVGRDELIRLVHPFFAKCTKLFVWLKKFLGYKDLSGGEIEHDLVLQQQTKEKHEGMAMEIDYRTLKRLGSSYRLLPQGFQQPKCTGRDTLCHEVLNDTLVSFPSWSEDSQSVTSRKTPFEEHMYRCEDERYQLDVVIETNLGAIRALETVNKKLARMSEDDKTKFRLDNYLGGTSEVTQRKAIHRIYGDKAPDMIEGLKKNPGVAVPLVLKRLKMKDEEWREAQLQFNKVWRSQCEKYYLKSLDHQGITFKGNDLRFIRSKSLLNEIETTYDERQESGDGSTGHHMTLEYEDKGIMDDAASLIIHHAKRQSAIHKDDKQRVRQVMYQILPDLYFAPRGNQPSDDEDDDDEDDNADVDKVEKQNNGKSNIKTSGGFSADDNLDGHYHLFFGNNNFYLFFRLHFILCERLMLMLRRSEILIEEENKEKKNRKGDAVAEMLQLRQLNEIEVEDYYPSFLDMVRNLLDGNVDCSQYEDTLREMFTIHAYHAFTMDRLVQHIVRQLQHIVQDETCIQLLDLYHAEESNQATGGALVSQSIRLSAESSYQRKAEHLTRGENCFKCTIGQKQNHLHVDIELLDTNKDGSIDLMEVATWSEYLDNYVNSDEVDVSRQLKERLTEKPVFLQRNANNLRRVAKNSDEEDQNLFIVGNLETKVQTGSYKMTFEPWTGEVNYRLGCFSSARKSHPQVAETIHNKFNSWLTKWENENVSRDMARQTNNWLMGKSHGLVNQVTTLQTKKFGKLTKNFYQVRYVES